MRTVITISLNGNAYQLDAVGFDALRAYLQVAEHGCRATRTEQEILADLEQAIADNAAATWARTRTSSARRRWRRCFVRWGPSMAGRARAPRRLPGRRLELVLDRAQMRDQA